MKKFLTPLMLLMLVGCDGGERVANAPRPGDTINVQPIEWRVVDRETLVRVYRNSGKQLPKGGQLEGFAGVRENGQAVIYTLAPRNVDDQVTCTIGHEFLHVALGEYHNVAPN